MGTSHELREKNKYKVANLAATVNIDINVYKDRDRMVNDFFITVYKAIGRNKHWGQELACGTTPGGTIHIMHYVNCILGLCRAQTMQTSLVAPPRLHSKTGLSPGHGSDIISIGCEQFNFWEPQLSHL